MAAAARFGRLLFFVVGRSVRNVSANSAGLRPFLLKIPFWSDDLALFLGRLSPSSDHPSFFLPFGLTFQPYSVYFSDHFEILKAFGLTNLPNQTESSRNRQTKSPKK